MEEQLDANFSESELNNIISLKHTNKIYKGKDIAVCFIEN
jgi:hypothetical protein